MNAKGTEDTKERKIGVTLECFVKKDGKYLMLHRNPNKRIMPNIWMAPGGHREFNEGLFECARREILEETGLTIKNIQVKAEGNAYVKDIDQEFYFHMLTAEYESGEVVQHENDGTLKWLTEAEILKLDNLLPELKHVLPHVFSNATHCISYTATYETSTKMTSISIES